MVYREVAMWEVLNVLERLHRGESQKAMGHADLAPPPGYTHLVDEHLLALVEEPE